MLVGGMMVFSLPWAWPVLGHRTGEYNPDASFETGGFFALCASIVVSFLIGYCLYKYVGGTHHEKLFRKEAMAVVALSWVLATVLGAMPFYFSGTCRALSVRLLDGSHEVHIYDEKVEGALDQGEYKILQAIAEKGARGIPLADLVTSVGASAPGILEDLAKSSPDWEEVLIFPNEEEDAPADRVANFRIRPIRMSIVDCLFESQSGFSTTGATVIADLEDPYTVPMCILFWRSSTHFLGGLGIIVLFVAILGHGSAGKTLMRAEIPGPSKEGTQTRMQHTAWIFTAIYCVMNLVEAIILKIFGMSWFDGICHAFGTLATGGFSTWNASVKHFNSAPIDYTIIIFMVLAGMNFSLHYLVLIGRPGKMLADIEWRTYMWIIAIVTLLVVCFGMFHSNYEHLALVFRHGLFQVVSIMTTTGFATDDFDVWNSFGRAVLFLLMFIGGCAGSTGGGLKVIRHILFVKILRLEVEQSFHPTVVRPLRLGGEAVEGENLRKIILVYFALIAIIFSLSWLAVVTIEPDETWGTSLEHKLIDSASAVSATLNNIGPGLGIIGATQNYTNFSSLSKLLFMWLMMLGRLELFVVLVIFMPKFWKSR